MHKLLVRLAIALSLAITATSCNSKSAAIDHMVDELNSPVFRAEQAKTGLFDDSMAAIDGDQLVITFLCRPFINLASIQAQDYDELQQSAVDEFRAKANIEDEFKQGLEALKASSMTIMLVWQDVNGATIRIPISPSDILDSKAVSQPSATEQAPQENQSTEA